MLVIFVDITGSSENPIVIEKVEIDGMAPMVGDIFSHYLEGRFRVVQRAFVMGEEVLPIAVVGKPSRKVTTELQVACTRLT